MTRLEDVEVARRRLAHEQRPGHVAPIARDLGAEVEQEDGPGPDRAVAGCAVRERRLGARQAGDVEGERLGPAGAHQPLQPQRQVGLGRVGPDLGQQRGERPVGDRAGGRDALDLGRFLDRPIGLEPALDRDELDVRRGGGEALPRGVRDEPGLDRDAPRPDRCHQLGPAASAGPGRHVDDAGLGRLAGGLDRIARIGQDREVVATDDELARGAGDLLLALGEGEAGQVAHVLASHAEVGIDAGRREPGPQACQPSRSRGPVRLGPSVAIGGRRRRREVRGDRPRTRVRPAGSRRRA